MIRRFLADLVGAVCIFFIPLLVLVFSGGWYS